MPESVGWLSIIPALAGSVMVIAISAGWARRDSAEITRALLKVQQRHPSIIEQRPGRWYHYLSLGALLALPFVQWNAYVECRTVWAVVIPLGAVANIMLAIGLFFPRMVNVQAPEHREWMVNGAVIAAGLGLGWPRLQPERY